MQQLWVAVYLSPDNHVVLLAEGPRSSCITHLDHAHHRWSNINNLHVMLKSEAAKLPGFHDPNPEATC